MAETSADQGDILGELLYLRKGAGMTPRQLAEARLVELLLRQGEDDSFGRLRSRLESAIRTLSDEESALLLAVYGLTDETKGFLRLADRRAIYAAQIDRGVATVSNREEPAIVRLMGILLRGTYRQSPLLVDVPEMHDGIIYETASTTITVENGMWRDTREHFRFAATFDEADYLTITRSYPAAVSTPDGSSFRVETKPASKGFDDNFWHRESSGADSLMRRGGSYDLRFELRPDPADPPTTMMTNAYRMLHHRALLAVLTVVFVGERPSTLWRYERVSHFAQPGSPSKQNVVTIAPDGTAEHIQRDVHGGLASGLAWIW